ncbi:MAG TPA: hypothetical protein PLU72_18360 [Candidatus Ozemobacteraceae bacterium]|nr:hypothetical protein [Candidatus Ozemobacteraceae bacterium]
MKNGIRAALDEADQVMSAFDAVRDLLIPDGDMSCVSRGNLCTLIDILNRRMHSALNAINAEL